jgi:hypothetical protein
MFDRGRAGTFAHEQAWPMVRPGRAAGLVVLLYSHQETVRPQRTSFDDCSVVVEGRAYQSVSIGVLVVANVDAACSEGT